MKSLKRITCLCAVSAFVLMLGGLAQAETVKATVFLATEKGPGASVGTVDFTDTPTGLAIKTDLKGLPPGTHGFHVHEKADCGAVEKDGKGMPAMAAGGHYDPEKTGKHLGPDNGGHLGDLPVLEVAADGAAKVTLRVKKAKAADFKDRALMIHAGGDNYSDEPAPLGGGGARIACGLIK
ncbi:MAG: superoxide dismutase family protein [Deltaproteobacteria bacterium]|jgi:Cu-Zn family superoxide dismutase|nr:superoxide dismutase family protein [Deltaproteobacteria bacterium]